MKGRWNNLVDALWHRPVATMDRSVMSLKRWFESPLGQVILEQQRPLIASVLEEQHKLEVALAISPAGGLLLQGCGLNSMQKVQLCPGRRSLNYGVNEGFTPLLADLDAVPLNDSSVDFVLLHHTLEFSTDPHQVLREAIRALAPGGQLLIVGFNPWSMVGLRRWLAGMTRGGAPWAHHSLSIARLVDWMHLMSCDIEGVARGFYGLPLQQRRGMQLFAPLDRGLAHLAAPASGFYMLHAQKRLFSRSGRLQTQSRSHDMIGLPVSAPAARQPHLKLVYKADKP